MATIILIPKPGKDPRQVGSLRPISHLSQTSEVSERLLERRVRENLQILDVLIPEQVGFHEGHSSTHQFILVIETITGARCSGKQSFAFFLDVEQAFDRV